MVNNKRKKDTLEGWDSFKINDVASIISGGTPDSKNPLFWNGSIDWITPTEIVKTGKYISKSTNKKITTQGLQNSSATLVPENSLILCSRATIGECAINTFPLTTNQGFKNLLPKENILIDFLYYKIIANKKYLIKMASGSTFLEFSKEDIKKFKIVVPSISEQKRIVKVLETWDKAIELINKKIEIKKNIKKGLMQRLLSGKIRLKGFKDEWEKVKIGDIVENVNKRNNNLQIKKVLTVTNKNGFVLPEEHFSKVVASENLKNYKIISKGEFAYNPSRINVGSIAKLKKYDKGVLSPMYVIFRTKEGINSEYLEQWLNTREANIKIRNSSAGSVRQTVDFKSFGLIKLYLPSRDEQEEIVNILSSVDKEIEKLEEKKNILQEQKKYLLNNLVTGAIRTPENLEVK
jgi:type I restriction enzyme S subunit